MTEESNGAQLPELERQKIVVDILVGQALDDLDQANLDVEGALRLVASRAWAEGYQDGRSGS